MISAEQLVLINEYCDTFEDALKSNLSPSIDEVVERSNRQLPASAQQTLLFELIALEIDYSKNKSETAAKLKSRYPKHGSTIDGIVDESTVQESAWHPNARVPSIAMGEVEFGDRFEVLNYFASGGLGDVFVAFDHHIKRKVAIKRLKPELADHEEAQKRFRGEGEITGAIEHPSIVPIYDSGENDNGLPYYAMRFLEGETLKAAINDLHSSPRTSEQCDYQQRTLLKRLVDICDAVSFAHANDVIHRDLKPSNILLGEYGESVVIDWGLAKRLCDPETELVSMESLPHFETNLGTVLGTPEYMSPEQARGEQDKITPASDVFSLGAILYSILTGVSPYREKAKNQPELVAAAQTVDCPTAIQRTPSVSKTLNAICAKAMASKPSDRYSTASQLGQDIDSWLSDRPTLALPESFIDKTSRFLRRHRRWSVAAALTLVAATVGSTIATSVINRQSSELAIRKQKADESLKGSIAAIKDFFQQVERSDAFNDTEATIELRKKLLTDGSEFLQQFLANNKDNPDLQFEVGKSLVMLTNFHNQLAENKASSEVASQAVEVLGQLCLDNSNQPLDSTRAQIVSLYSRALLRKAEEIQSSSGLSDAEPMYLEAIDKSKPLTSAVLDGNHRLDPNLAMAHFDSRIAFANATFHSGQRESGLAIADDFFREMTEFAKSHPDNPTVLSKAAQNINRAGVLHAWNGHTLRASERYRVSAELARSAIQIEPETNSHKRQLAGALGNLTIALKDLAERRRIAGEAPYNEEQKNEIRNLQLEVTSIFEAAAKRHPGNARRQREYIKAVCNGGSLLNRLESGNGLPYLIQGKTLLDEFLSKCDYESEPQNWLWIAKIKSVNLGSFAEHHARMGEYSKQVEYRKEQLQLENQIWRAMPQDKFLRQQMTYGTLLNEAVEIPDTGKPAYAMELFAMSLTAMASSVSNKKVLLRLGKWLVEPFQDNPAIEGANSKWSAEFTTAYSHAYQTFSVLVNEFDTSGELDDEIISIQKRLEKGLKESGKVNLRTTKPN